MFLVSGRRRTEFNQESDYLNEYDFYEWHPLHKIGIYQSREFGLLCQYGRCFFSDVDNRTHTNVINALRKAVNQYNDDLFDYLTYLSNPEVLGLRKGGMDVEDWIRVSDELSHHAQAHILNTVFSIDCTYRDVEHVIASYKKGRANSADNDKEKRIRIAKVKASAKLKLLKLIIIGK